MNEPNYTPINVDYTVVPAEVKKWNWGAFMFNAIWGIGNHAYLSLLCFVPILNIVWVFVCGAMGNQWAWKSGKFKDVEQFLAVQNTWNRAGLVIFIISIVSTALFFLFGIAMVSALVSALPY